MFKKLLHVSDFAFSGHFSCEQCSKSPIPIYTIWFGISNDGLTDNDGTLAICPQSHLTHHGYSIPKRNKEFPNSFVWKDKWMVAPLFKPGDLLIFNAKTIHASTKNRRNRFRIRFVPQKRSNNVFTAPTLE